MNAYSKCGKCKKFRKVLAEIIIVIKENDGSNEKQEPIAVCEDCLKELTNFLI